MPYVTVSDGKIQARKLEYNAVDHCNLSCKECSHFSPYMSAQSLSLETFEKDINRLAEVYKVERFRFVGGEPLLNRNILNYIKVVRKSGITDKIELATNGLLLNKSSDELVSAFDIISVSWYPHNMRDFDYLNECKKKCSRLNTRLSIEKISKFRTMQVGAQIQDAALVDDIYRTCMIAHTWFCQTFYDGHFYLCSRPIFTDQYLQKIEGTFTRT